MFFRKSPEVKATTDKARFFDGEHNISDNVIDFKSSEDVLFDSLSKSKGSIQSYRYAVEIANQSNDLDMQIRAFQAVLEIASYEQTNPADSNGHKRLLIMFWCYNNIGDAFAKKNYSDTDYEYDEANYSWAIKYYKKALDCSKDNVEKISVMRRISQVYQDWNDDENWLLSQEAIIDFLDDAHKREAYTDLASSCINMEKKKDLLEKALLFVMQEDVSVLIKCQNTLNLGCELKGIYKKNKDYTNYGKVEELMDKTNILATRAIEEKIANEPDRSKKLSLYVKLLNLGGECMGEESPLKKKYLRKLYDLLDDGEVLKVGDKKYNKKSLSNVING